MGYQSEVQTMTWQLETATDESVALIRADGLELSAQPISEHEDRTVWFFTVEDVTSGECLTRHGWEIRDDEHLWAVLDGFTHRFDQRRPIRTDAQRFGE